MGTQFDVEIVDRTARVIEHIEQIEHYDEIEAHTWDTTDDFDLDLEDAV